MIEYLYDAVIANAGSDISITAVLDDGKNSQEENCFLTLYNDEEPIAIVEGLFVPDMGVWSFAIPAKETAGLSGRYWYEISNPDMSFGFKQPIYLK